MAVSDAGGRFVFDELEAGRFTLTLFHSEFAPVLRSVDVDPKTRESEIEIELTGGGEIRGVVIDSDGLPVAGADLVVYRGMRAFDLRMTSTAEDGTFRFPLLAAGLACTLFVIAMNVAGLLMVIAPRFPSELVWSALLTSAPWFFAGITAYFATALVIIEPLWWRRFLVVLLRRIPSGYSSKSIR